MKIRTMCRMLGIHNRTTRRAFRYNNNRDAVLLRTGSVGRAAYHGFRHELRLSMRYGWRPSATWCCDRLGSMINR